MARKDSIALARRRQGNGAGTLFFLGSTLFAGGLVSATAPLYSAKVARISDQAAAYGLERGTLLLGGMVFLGLALVLRVAARASKREPETNPLGGEIRLLGDQLSAKLAQLRTGLLQIAEDVATLSAQQAAHFQRQAEHEATPQHGQDGLFRLAASLDKLGAHIDERFHGLDLALRSGLESLAVGSQRSGAAGGFHPSPAAAQHMAGVPLEPELDDYSGSSAHGHGGYGQADDQQEDGIDFYETMQKLDAISGEDQPSAGREPSAPFPSTDSLDALLPEEYRDRN